MNTHWSHTEIVQIIIQIKILLSNNRSDMIKYNSPIGFQYFRRTIGLKAKKLWRIKIFIFVKFLFFDATESYYDCTISNLCNRPSNQFLFRFWNRFWSFFMNGPYFFRNLSKMMKFRKVFAWATIPLSDSIMDVYIRYMNFSLSHWLITESSPLFSTIIVYHWLR